MPLHTHTLPRAAMRHELALKARARQTKLLGPSWGARIMWSIQKLTFILQMTLQNPCCFSLPMGGLPSCDAPLYQLPAYDADTLHGH
jgi:hypothetical protein